MNVNIQTILFICLIGLGACSTSNNQSSKNTSELIQPSQSAITPISEQRLAVSEFKTQGAQLWLHPYIAQLA